MLINLLEGLSAQRNVDLTSEMTCLGLKVQSTPRIGSGSLTQLGGLAENEGVCPEFGDGGAVETGVTHRLSEAAGCEDVKHVESGPESSYDTVK